MITSRDLALIRWPRSEEDLEHAGGESPRPSVRDLDHGSAAPHGGRRDVIAGMLLLNTLPHTLMGLTGHRCRTPWGGVSSSAGQNLAWAALNLGGALGLLASKRCTGQAEADRRRVRVGTGLCAMALFGLLYDASPAGRQDRLLREDAVRVRGVT